MLKKEETLLRDIGSMTSIGIVKQDLFSYIFVVRVLADLLLKEDIHSKYVKISTVFFM